MILSRYPNLINADGTMMEPQLQVSLGEFILLIKISYDVNILLTGGNCKRSMSLKLLPTTPLFGVFKL